MIDIEAAEINKHMKQYNKTHYKGDRKLKLKGPLQHAVQFLTSNAAKGRKYLSWQCDYPQEATKHIDTGNQKQTGENRVSAVFCLSRKDQVEIK